MKKILAKIRFIGAFTIDYLIDKVWMFKHRIQFRDAVDQAKDLRMRKGTQHHVIRIEDKFMVVDNRWMKNYNKLIRRRGRKLDYVRLCESALYSTR